MHPLRILNVANVPEDPDAGAAGAEFQIIRALRAAGHEVDALWSSDVGRKIAHGNLHYLLELPRRYEQLVVDRLGRKSYDVVNVSQPHGFRAARAVHRRWPQVAFVHRSHGFEPRVHEIVERRQREYGGDPRPVWRRAGTALLGRALGRHDTAITRDADGHIVCSTQDAAYMTARYAVPPGRIAVITHAAPDEYVRLPAAPLTAARLRHVLYVGQYAFVKAPMIVAAAMNGIAAAMPDARFTWVAAGAHHDAIRSLLTPECAGRVTLLSWMPQLALRDVFDGAGIFLFPSFFEGTGKASIEALSRGLCVVASDIGGMHDMIVDGRSGILVPPGDAPAVAAAALDLMRSPERAAEMSAAAASRAREFTWHRTAAATADFYARLRELRR